MIAYIRERMAVSHTILTLANPALHYKLSTENGEGGESKLAYMPFLEPKRDAPLLKLLPDYLSEEILFNREQADMFFWRISNVLQRKLEA